MTPRYKIIKSKSTETGAWLVPVCYAGGTRVRNLQIHSGTPFRAPKMGTGPPWDHAPRSGVTSRLHCHGSPPPPPALCLHTLVTILESWGKFGTIQQCLVASLGINDEENGQEMGNTTQFYSLCYFARSRKNRMKSLREFFFFALRGSWDVKKNGFVPRESRGNAKCD